MVFTFEFEDLAVALINPKLNVLQVLCVIPAHRGHQLGSALIAYLNASFARVLESAVDFFARNGYQSIGEMKQGKMLKTQIMVKSSLIPLAGRIAAIYGKQQDRTTEEKARLCAEGD